MNNWSNLLLISQKPEKTPSLTACFWPVYLQYERHLFTKLEEVHFRCRSQHFSLKKHFCNVFSNYRKEYDLQLQLLSMNWKLRHLIGERSGFFSEYYFLLLLISILDHLRSTVLDCNFSNTYFSFSALARIKMSFVHFFT